MAPLLVLVALAAFMSGPATAAPPISAAFATRIKDLRASATMEQANLEALGKIGKDYANAYRCRSMETYFKEPDRIRFEMKALGITFIYVINGNTKYTAVQTPVPRLGRRETDDISRRPQTKQNSLEIGFITPSALNDFRVRYLRQERAGSRTLHVYELRYRQKDQQRKKILLWVDIERKVLGRRELYRDDGTLKARFTYLNPVQVAPGIWVPTRITVHNADGEFGGVTHYSNIRVNTGLPDSLFQGA